MAQFVIDHAGLPAGTLDRARTDGLDDGSLVTLDATGGGGNTFKFELLWTPVGDTTAVPSLAPTGNPAIWTFAPTASQHGTYRIKLTTNEGEPDETSVIRTFTGGQINTSFSYRFAEDEAESRSKQYIVTLNPLFRFVAGGETSIKVQAYRQLLDAVGTVSYRLTDNLHGKRGIIWSIRSDYRVRRNLKFAVSFNGRHSDDRKPRIIGRGELIASF